MVETLESPRNHHDEVKLQVTNSHNVTVNLGCKYEKNRDRENHDLPVVYNKLLVLDQKQSISVGQSSCL